MERTASIYTLKIGESKPTLPSFTFLLRKYHTRRVLSRVKTMKRGEMNTEFSYFNVKLFGMPKMRWVKRVLVLSLLSKIAHHTTTPSLSVPLIPKSCVQNKWIKKKMETQYLVFCGNGCRRRYSDVMRTEACYLIHRAADSYISVSSTYQRMNWVRVWARPMQL